MKSSSSLPSIPSTARSSASSSAPSYSPTSSEDDRDEDYLEIDETKQRLAQMKRHNRGKGTLKIQASSRLLAKLGNVLTPEQRALKQTAERIEKGLRDVLKLHHPTELSSICGQLKLKTLLRGDESIEQLIDYCKDEKETQFTAYSQYKVNRLCNNMWEGETYSSILLFVVLLNVLIVIVIALVLFVVNVFCYFCCVMGNVILAIIVLLVVILLRVVVIIIILIIIVLIIVVRCFV